MKLYDELYFEITAEGKREDLLKLASYLKSDALEDFFKTDEDYIIYDDEFYKVDESATTSFIFTNDDYGIEITSFDPESFLDLLCKNARQVNLYGNLFDCEDTEYRFSSPEGTTSYENTDEITDFNDELDRERSKEESKNYDSYDM